MQYTRHNSTQDTIDVFPPPIIAYIANQQVQLVWLQERSILHSTYTFDIGTGMTPNSDWFNRSKSVTVSLAKFTFSKIQHQIGRLKPIKNNMQLFNVFLNVAREISPVQNGCRKCRFLWSKEKATQRSNLDQKFALPTLSYTILSSGK